LWQPNSAIGNSGIAAHSMRTPRGRWKVCFIVVFSTAWRSAVSIALSPSGAQSCSKRVGL
jgi:hypothetical protein